MQNFPGQYREQLDFLDSSARAYDAGGEPEAKRLALHIRLMVHDTKHQTSLLKHLGIKERLPYVHTTSPDLPQGAIQIASGGLVRMVLKTGNPGSVEYRPPLGTASPNEIQPPTSFTEWWTRPVLDDAAGNAFARKDLVLAVADQDGGAHVDATLAAAYGALTRANSMGLGQVAPDEPNAAGLSFAMEGVIRVSDPDATPPDNSIALASVRQIAYELTTSLKASVSDEGDAITLHEEICRIPLSDAPCGRRSQ